MSTPHRTTCLRAVWIGSAVLAFVPFLILGTPTGAWLGVPFAVLFVIARRRQRAAERISAQLKRRYMGA